MRILATAALLALGTAASGEALIIIGDALVLPPVNYVEAGETAVFQNATNTTVTIASSGEGTTPWTTGQIAPGASVSLPIATDLQLGFAVVGDEQNRNGTLSFDAAPEAATPGG